MLGCVTDVFYVLELYSIKKIISKIKLWKNSACSTNINLTLEHKTSHKCQFFKIEIYASSEIWINNISIDVWFVMIVNI